MKNADEITKSCHELHITCTKLTGPEAKDYISQALKKFNVQKTSGHLAIQHNSETIPLDEHEFSYSKNLSDEPVYLFFDQSNLNKDEVVMISKSKKAGSVLQELRLNG